MKFSVWMHLLVVIISQQLQRARYDIMKVPNDPYIPIKYMCICRMNLVTSNSCNDLYIQR